MPFLLHTQTSSSRQVYWIVHRILPVLSLVFLTISSMFGTKKRKLPKLNIVEYSMAAYVFMSMMSIIMLSNEVLLTLYRFYDLLFIPMCLYMIIRLYIPYNNSMQLLVPVAVIITVTQVAVGALSWVAPSVLPSVWLKYAGVRTTGTLKSVSVYTTTLFFSGLILLNTGLLSKYKWKRYLFVFLFLLTIIAAFFSFSRASWLAGILLLLGLIVIYPKFMRRLVFACIVLSILMGSLFIQSNYFEIASNRLASEESDNSALGRLPVYLAAFRMFKQKPLFGWGYDNFDRFDRKYQGRFGDIVNPDEKDLTSHNVYLTMLAEQGLIGLSLYLIPFVILLLRSKNTLNNLTFAGTINKSMFLSFWLIIMTFFVVQNLSPMVVVYGLGVNWITLGLIANYIYLKSP